MKKRLLALAICAAALPAMSQSAWITDLAVAQQSARKANKQILLNFTGSDWCSWCKKMKADTLDKKDFLAYAAKNLVLVEVDFPDSKPQTDALKQANAALKEKYLVRGYPTFVLLDAEGKELGRQVGYLQGGSVAFAGKINAWKESSVKQSPKPETQTPATPEVEKPQEPKPKSATD